MDGTLTAWGNNDNGQCSVPVPNAEFVALAAGQFHSLGLKRMSPIAVTFSDLTAESGRDFVDLRWSVSLDVRARLFVLRASEWGGPYEPISAALEGSPGRAVFSYRDASVVDARTRYYRIGCDEDGVWSYSSPIRVSMPRGTLAFLGTSPNPARGDELRLMFELGRTGGVSIDVYDVAGRRVRRVTDGHMAAGVRTVEWDGRGEDGKRLPAGVYCVRIGFDGAATSGKFVVAR